MKKLISLSAVFALIASVSHAITGGFDHEKFRIAVMGPESGRDYTIMNFVTGSAAGAYQIIPSTLADLGYTYSTNGSWNWNSVAWTGKSQSMGVSTLDDFRFSAAGHRLQDTAFDEFTDRNWQALSGTAKSNIGKVVNGVVVTEGGLLSAAHFLGAGGMNNFAANGFDGSNLNNLSAILRQNGFADVARLNRYVMQRIAGGAAAHGGVAGASGYGGTVDGASPYSTDVIAGAGGGVSTVSGVCLSHPVMSSSGAAVTSPYGMDRTGRASAGYHQGLDLVNSVGMGDPIYAGVAGKVIVAGAGSGGMNRVVIETSDGSQRFVFMHLASIHRDVRVPNATVQPDTQIGTMGNTGTRAIHLHLSALMSGDKLQSAGVESRVWASTAGWVGTKSAQPLSADQIAGVAPDSFYFVNPEPFLPERVPFRPNLLTAYADQGLVRPDGLTLPNNCAVEGSQNRLSSSGGGVSMSELGGNALNHMGDVGYAADMAMAEMRDAFVDLTKISADNFANSLQETRAVDRPIAALGMLIMEANE